MNTRKSIMCQAKFFNVKLHYTLCQKHGLVNSSRTLLLNFQVYIIDFILRYVRKISKGKTVTSRHTQVDRVTSPTSQTTNTQTDQENSLSDCETVQISPDRPYRLQLKFTQQTQTDLRESEDERSERSVSGAGLQRGCSTLLFSQKTQTSDCPGFISGFTT